MTDDALLVVKTLFQVIWRLFTSWYIPGTNVTPAMMGLFLMSAVIGLKLLARFMGADVAVGGAVDRYGRAQASYKQYFEQRKSISERSGHDTIGFIR